MLVAMGSITSAKVPVYTAVISPGSAFDSDE
jgi:hypothetical protein